MHVVGATGGGKSFFLESIIRQLIVRGDGICLLDPHGDLYHRILSFCAYLNTKRPELNLAKRIIPFDIAETKNILGFNPVQRNARVMTYQVVALMEAIRKSWGQTSFYETPRLARWLFNTAFAVVDSKTTFLQMYNMVNPGPDKFRPAITKRLSDPVIREEWEFLENLTFDKREGRIESCLNRLKPFLGHEVIKFILGQQSKTVSFESVLSEKKIVLVNLARQRIISEDDQKMLGTLIVNELLTAAFARPQNDRPPFYVCIDEFQKFVTKDICEILDGGRKFGLHLIIAHQFLNQLKEKDPEVYYSTLTNTRIKAVFGGLDDKDLDILAKEMYAGSFSPYIVKDEIWQTKYEPRETTRTIITESDSSSESESSGQVSHVSLASGEVYIPGSNFLASSEQQSTSHSQTSGESESRARQKSRSSGASRTEVPFFEYHAYKELSSRTFLSLEEQLYIKKAQMKRQPTQHFCLLAPDQEVQIGKSLTVKNLSVSDSEERDFRRTCFEESGCFSGPEEIRQEISSLEQQLLSETQETIEVDTNNTSRPKRAKKDKKKSPLRDLIGSEHD